MEIILFGAGRFGKYWLRNLLEVSKEYGIDFKVVGKRNKNCSKTYQNLLELVKCPEKIYRSYDRFVKNPSGDIWIIATSPRALFDVYQFGVESFQKNGFPKGIIVEKPFIISKDQYKSCLKLFEHNKIPRTLVDYIELWSITTFFFINELTSLYRKSKKIKVEEERIGKFERRDINIFHDWIPHSISKLALFLEKIDKNAFSLRKFYISKNKIGINLGINDGKIEWIIKLDGTQNIRKRVVTISSKDYYGFFDYLTDSFYVKGKYEIKKEGKAENKMKKILRNVINGIWDINKIPIEKIVQREMKIRFEIFNVLENFLFQPLYS